jgi:hypothetical protein
MQKDFVGGKRSLYRPKKDLFGRCKVFGISSRRTRRRIFYSLAEEEAIHRVCRSSGTKNVCQMVVASWVVRGAQIVNIA